MKSWFVSSLLLFAPAARADAEAVATCLDRSDIVCAEEAARDLGTDALSTAMRGRLAYYHADFPSAVTLMEAAQPKLKDQEGFAGELQQMVATRDATDGFLVVHQGDVEIRYLPGLDAILLDEAFETLQAAHDRIGAVLGGAPPGGVRMEIYPNAARFIAASSLPASAVRTTGVVALSKWTRVLLTSPRTLGRGYGWRDTLAHEYIHYIVSWRSKDRTPVWLQEGIARACESLWQADKPPALPPYQQGLLAKALATDSFVPFSKMHPSFALLPTAEEASLAYAQVATMVWTLQKAAGTSAISDVLDKIGGGQDALQAVADVGAGGDVDAFMNLWKDDLRAMNLVFTKLEAMPTVVTPADDDFAVDPVLATRKDVAGKVRLGDLLLGAQRPEAALVEYERAIPDDEPPSPVLSARMAQAWTAVQKPDKARQVLETSVVDYPEFALTQKMLGELYLTAGRQAEALARFRASADINPYDPVVQERLATLYGTMGQPALAERHARYRRLLATGGVEPASGVKK